MKLSLANMSHFLPVSTRTEDEEPQIIQIYRATKMSFYKQHNLLSFSFRECLL